MSIGEAFYPADGSNAEELLATADRRMYKNKQAQKLERGGAAAVPEESPLAALSVQ
jgi:GGDEF domain-containing protein